MVHPVAVPGRRVLRNLVLEVVTFAGFAAPVLLAALVAGRAELVASLARTSLLLFVLLILTAPIRPSFFGGGSWASASRSGPPRDDRERGH